jgi:hypothetical protein
MKKYRKLGLTLCLVLLVSLVFCTTAYAAPSEMWQEQLRVLGKVHPGKSRRL